MDPGQANSVMRTSKYSALGERDMFAMAGTFAIRGFWPPTDSVAPDPPNTFALSAVKIHLRSVSGSVRLRSTDPREPPDINFNMFASKEPRTDLDAYVDTIKWARRVFTSVKAPLEPTEPIEPPCNGNPDEDGGCDDEVDRQWIMDQMLGTTQRVRASLGQC